MLFVANNIKEATRIRMAIFCNTVDYLMSDSLLFFLRGTILQR